MISYLDRSFCNTTNCPHFDKECGKSIVANKELREEANSFGLPIALMVYDLNADDQPIGCRRYEELNKK